MKHLFAIKRIYWVIPSVILLAFIALRLPALLQEVEPYLFCDESIYFSQVKSLYFQDRWVTDEFRAGGTNIYPALIAVRAIGNFVELSGSDILLIGRAIYLLLISVIGVVFIYLTSVQIHESRTAGVVAVFLFLLSPYVFAMSRYWYPDHFIMCFSAGLLYFLIKLLKSKAFSYGALVGLASCFALLVSTKYTGLIAGAPIAMMLISRVFQKRNEAWRKDVLRAVFCISGAGLLIFLLLNFSLFHNFSEFVKGFMYNIHNYDRGSSGNSVNFDGIIFYLAAIYILSFGMLGLPLYIYGYLRLFRQDISVLLVLLSFPVALICTMGLSGIVLNRNVSILFPFTLPTIVGSIIYLASRLKIRSPWRYVLAAYIGTFLAASFYDVSRMYIRDFRPDSRIVAASWIKENIPPSASVGHNEYCSGPSSAAGHISNLVFDGNLSNRLDYYVINSYWKSTLSPAYRSEGLLEQKNQKLHHFYNFNDRRLLKNSGPKNSEYAIETLIEGYELAHRIDSNGPVIYILKKLDTAF